ncbi:carbohydrate kinase family protein [[Limnothrix rosea] IAM M-220]|uniref:carbohydrate kinase family protein n=1 Tax=[Limnothrix rosea] IAM M-220 TaxID=454133 RepID=UPI00095B03AF|nr:carbohydrate kinase [[Limnothrix rosea] IAM M-220]OKH18184.1 carbohydrate kinase [[Limnothrix rosea] IAM M-220]
MNHQPSIIFGEVLWDCFPDGNKVLGGAPFNVAWHLQAFGQAPILISRIGDDSAGQKILQAMGDWGMTLDGVQVDPKLGTGIVTVRLKDGQPSYDIEHPKAYDHIDSYLFPDFPTKSLLYHGSLAIRNDISKQALATLKTSISGTVFFDVNFRDPWWTAETIQHFLSETTWLKLNDEELPALVPNLQDRDEQIATLFEQRNTEYILLTEGAAGATLIPRQGDRLNIKPDKTTTVVDTVGAGDAFCSILLLGISLNWPLAQTLERAQTFASAIVGIQGATTTDKNFYQLFQDAWF